MTTLSQVLLEMQKLWLLNNADIHAFNKGSVEITLIDTDDQTRQYFFWDLTKETLEEQPKPTQDRIKQIIKNAYEKEE